MKGYVKTILRGGTFLEFETQQYGLNYIFLGNDDTIIAFEGNHNEQYEPGGEVLRESYWECSKDRSYYLQTNQVPNDNGVFISLYADDKRIALDYVKNCKVVAEYNITKKLSKKIYRKIKKLELQGFVFDCHMTATGIITSVYKLKGGWLFFNSEIVYARHPHSISIVARNKKRAQEIENNLVSRMRCMPKSYYTRHERFNINRAIDKYNAGEECNRLKYKYFNILKEAYEKYDFSKIFEYLDDNCKWTNVEGKLKVISSLKVLAERLKKKNYECTIVQVGNPNSPIECNTKPDGSGQKVMLGLGFYNAGEVCMVITYENTYDFLKMELSLDGSIRELYDTLPSENITPVNPADFE